MGRIIFERHYTGLWGPMNASLNDKRGWFSLSIHGHFQIGYPDSG